MKILNLLKRTGKLILYIGGVYLLAFILLMISLRLYTNHRKSYPVPDFKGLSLERVAQLAEYNHLQFEVSDSIFVNHFPKGHVVDQHPLPGVKVKKNRTIFLTTNAHSRAKVEMPNVVGVSFRQGKSTLEMLGLKVGKLIYKPDFAKNNILQQLYNGKEIEKGTMITKDETIDLVLGNGLGKSLSAVPNLYKKNYQQAIGQINDNFFNIGKINFDQTVKNYKDSLNAKVIKQYPEYSRTSKAIIGSFINIWLSNDDEKFRKADSILDAESNTEIF